MDGLESHLFFSCQALPLPGGKGKRERKEARKKRMTRDVPKCSLVLLHRGLAGTSAEYALRIPALYLMGSLSDCRSQGTASLSQEQQLAWGQLPSSLESLSVWSSFCYNEGR